MTPFFKPTEKDLIQIKAGDLREGYTFWIKQDDGTFDMAVVDLKWYPTPDMLAKYREGIKKFSVEGKLFARRDKPGKSFRDLL